MIPSASDSASTRPYLIRALYEWCTDNGFTPYVAVLVDDTVQVPREYVRNGEIVLNISPEATSALKLGNDYIEFKARFAGTARDIMVPVERVIAIYARENGQGMAFPAPAPVPGTAVNGPVATPIGERREGGGAGEGRNTREGRAADARGSIQLVPVSVPMPAPAAADSEALAEPAASKPDAADASGPEADPPRPAGGSRPSLKRIK
ncbi:MAG: ClpXP protease specificity-enhancing factor [Burkholderiaceae bacterium]